MRFLFKQLSALMKGYISRAYSFNPGAKFLILLHDFNHGNDDGEKNETAFKVFSLMYNRYNAANVIFLYAVDVNRYNVYITNPYQDPHECGSLKPILLDVCKNGKLQNKFLTKIRARSPKVPKALPNCVFKFCAQVTEPYINDKCTSGLEMQIISVLQEVLKFKVNTICTKKSRGEPFGNGSWSHLLGMLRNDQCDFVVGGFFPDFDVHNDFGVTTSYLQDSFTWYDYLVLFP